jgi:hypothetical protein
MSRMEALCVRVCEFAGALIVPFSAPIIFLPAPVPAPMGGDVVASVNVDTRAAAAAALGGGWSSS